MYGPQGLYNVIIIVIIYATPHTHIRHAGYKHSRIKTVDIWEGKKARSEGGEEGGEKEGKQGATIPCVLACV